MLPCQRSGLVILTSKSWLGRSYGEGLASCDVPPSQQFEWLREYPQKRSLTELEMARAALTPSLGVLETLFFLRSDEYLKTVPTQTLPLFKDGATRRVAGSTRFKTNSQREAMLQDLISRVRFSTMA